MESFRITDNPSVKPDKESLSVHSQGMFSKATLRDGKAVARALIESKTAPDEKQPEKISTKDLQKVIDKVNPSLQIADTRIQMKVDEQTGKTVITIVNSANGETIREIPEKSLLKIAAAVDEYLKSGQEKESLPEGVVVDKKV